MKALELAGVDPEELLFPQQPRAAARLLQVASPSLGTGRDGSRITARETSDCISDEPPPLTFRPWIQWTPRSAHRLAPSRPLR